MSARAGRKGGAKLEGSETGKPSRRSTRRSQGRVKRTTALQRRATGRATSPSRRAAKAKARRPRGNR